MARAHRNQPDEARTVEDRWRSVSKCFVTFETNFRPPVTSFDPRRLSAQGHGGLIVLPPPCPLNVLPSEFSHADELIEQAYELASTALDHPDPGAYWTPRSLQRLQPHSH